MIRFYLIFKLSDSSSFTCVPLINLVFYSSVSSAFGNLKKPRFFELFEKIRKRSFAVLNNLITNLENKSFYK